MQCFCVVFVVVVVVFVLFLFFCVCFFEQKLQLNKQGIVILKA